MKSQWIIVSAGLALFSMFFGSGNLVFPIAVGQESDGHYLLSALGIISTGVIVPFLGVFGMMLYNGDIDSFFSCFGKRGTFIFTLLSLALMGPFGVLARCLTVAHGSLLLLIPNASLPLTSLCMCIVIFFLALNKSRIVTIIGTVLTPFLLLTIGVITYFGFSQNVEPGPIYSVGWDALKNGFLQGYQTMDLLAAFFFSKFLIGFFRSGNSSDNQSFLLKMFSTASLLAAGILSVVYLALVSLGWEYTSILENTPPQEMLVTIAAASLGSMAAPIVCLAVISACLTTGIVLTSLFADFFRTRVTGDRIGSPISLFLTLTVGFFVSTLDFDGIASFLGPLLEIIYPALITLTIVNIANAYAGFRTSHWAFTLTIAAKICFI